MAGQMNASVVHLGDGWGHSFRLPGTPVCV